MNALTGGCHFDDDCGRYAIGCGLCPQLGSNDLNDLSRQVWRRKQFAFERVDAARLHIIALNRWMAEAAQRSPLLAKFPVTIVPNGVDTEVFQPQDRRKAREFLGIPQDRRVVLFAAEAVTNRRKGLALLMAALTQLQGSENLLLVSVGRGAPKLSTEIPHLHLAHVDEDHRLAAIYSAADLYVIPSLQDNQPNTVLEAMACGTPVVGFAVGGIPDMVRPGITGLLASAGDVNDLARAITELLRGPDKRASMAAASRRLAVTEYTRELQVDRYVALYWAAFERHRPAISHVLDASLGAY
jgi:glycosyltransferase involved in cell wall biosynthesis